MGTTKTTQERVVEAANLIATGAKIGDAIKKVGLSPVTFYRWRKTLNLPKSTELGTTAAPTGKVAALPVTAANYKLINDDQFDFLANVFRSGMPRDKARAVVSIVLQ